MTRHELNVVMSALHRQYDVMGYALQQVGTANQQWHALRVERDILERAMSEIARIKVDES